MNNYKDLLIWQYGKKPKAVATIEGFGDAIEECWNGMNQIMQSLDVDLAFGKSLDNVAARVGASRYLKKGVDRIFFGFKDKANSAGFGGSSGYKGGVFYRFGASTFDPMTLEDEDLRTYIKMKIWKNYQIPTLPYMLAFLKEFFGEYNYTLVDNEDMTISVAIYGTLTPVKEILLANYDCLPRPAGVAIVLNSSVTATDSLYRFATVNLPGLVNP